MAAITKKKVNAPDTETTTKNNRKQLSKIGEWLESKQSALTILDMRAVLQ